MIRTPASDLVASARSAYERLQSLCGDSTVEPSQAGAIPESFSPVLSEISEQLHDVYLGRVREFLRGVLDEFGAAEDSTGWQRMVALDFYPRGLPVFIATFLFWAWENRLTLDDTAVDDLISAMLEGTVGYRLVDLHLDDGWLGPEAAVLGGYLIGRYERRLSGLFGHGSPAVLDQYARKYAQVEFLEKANRWKGCPFSWDDTPRLGWKGAPIAAVLHLLMESACVPKTKIERVSAATILALAALQMSDDWRDAADDLASGTETLVASGFYCWNSDRPVTAERVAEFLDQTRTRTFLNRALDLLNSSLDELYAVEEPVLAYAVEQMKRRLLATVRVQPAPVNREDDLHEAQ